MVPDKDYEELFSQTTKTSRPYQMILTPYLMKGGQDRQDRTGNSSEEPRDTNDLDSIRAFVQFLIEKILDQIYHEANIVL